MSISFPCPLCGHQVTVPKAMAGERTTCEMCNFKVEVPKAVVVPPRPKAAPPPPPPPEPEPEPEPELVSEPELSPVEQQARKKQRTRRVAAAIGVLAVAALVWYWVLSTPQLSRMIPGMPHPYFVPTPKDIPPGPLSPADYDPPVTR